MAANVGNFLRTQLLDRREKLQSVLAMPDHSGTLHLLLEEVDTALARLEEGSYGVCEECHHTIESDRLVSDPLVRFCLSCLSRAQRDALELDLQLAAQVQRGLLPPLRFERNGWQACYYYQPAGLVSGDYCDIIDAGDAGLFFMLGDVSGKGVAASMLMAHLHATFRGFLSARHGRRTSLECMLSQVGRIFCESTLPNQYVTLVCVRALPDGRIEISNAGHPAPLLVRNGAAVAHEPSHLPLGMFCQEEFTVSEFELKPGDGVVIYSDGVSEALSPAGLEYGAERLRELIDLNRGAEPEALINACRSDLASFVANTQTTDDVALLALARISQEPQNQM